MNIVNTIKNLFSRKRKIDFGISATELRNYFINDPILDWFKHYGEMNGFARDSSKNYIDFVMNRGNEFEEYIIGELGKKKNFVNIRENYNEFCEDGVIDTINAMKNGIEIIYQGYLYNSDLGIYGIPDLLIRGDILSSLFENDVMMVKPYNNEFNWNYYVVDIKFSTLHIGKENQILNESGKRFYKAQLFIYNQILDNLFFGENEYFNQPKAFILSRRIIIEGKIHSGLNLLGEVDFNDEPIGGDVDSALNWVREVKRVGMNWDIYNPHTGNLRPNMKNRNDYPWHNAKQIVSKRMEELTRVWNVSVKIRENVKNSGESVMSHFKECRGEIVGKMVGELRIKNEYDGLDKYIRDDIMNFYVDFEYINGVDLSFEKDTRVHLYMIGVGYEEMGEWEYKVFIPDYLGDREEKRNINNWINFMRMKSKDNNGYQIIHWTHAESSLYKRLKRDLRIRGELNWMDLQVIFRSNGIVYDGMNNFSLKTVAGVMRKLGYIESGWDNEIVDGLGANLMVIDGLKAGGKLVEMNGMKELIRYNEIDCKVLYEILGYLSSEAKKNM